LQPDFPAMERMLKIEPVRNDLARIGTESPAVLLARQMFSSDSIGELAGEGPVNTDDLPLLEYQAPKAHYVHVNADVLDERDQRLGRGSDLFGVRYLRTHPLDRKSCRALIELWCSEHVNNRKLELAMINYYMSHWPDDPWALSRYASVGLEDDLSGAVAASKRMVRFSSGEKALEQQARIIFTERSRVHSAFTPQDFQPALDLLDRAMALDPKNDSLRTMRGRIEEYAR